jgi:gliding motility-associated-like protein
VCQPEDSMSYAIKAVYQSCENIVFEHEAVDTMIVHKSFNPFLVTSITAADCNNGGIGSILVLNPVGPTIEYSLDGTNWQSSNFFSVPSANYNLQARVVGSSCGGFIQAPVLSNIPFSCKATVKNLTCFNNNTGVVTFNPFGSAGPYFFSINGGPYQAGNIFNGLAAGTYTFKVKDFYNCAKDTIITLTQPPILNSAANTFDATCIGNNGKIIINQVGGTVPYMFSINGGTSYQVSDTFIVAAGNYPFVFVKDINGCISSSAVTVALNDTMRLDVGPDTNLCAGSSYNMKVQTNTLTNFFSWAPRAGLNDSTLANPVATPADTTRYILTAKWGVCTRKDTMVVYILKKPVAYAGNDTVICYRSSAMLHGRATNISGPVIYSWMPSVLVDPPSNPNAHAYPVRNQVFTLTVSDNYGCNFSHRDSMAVTVLPPVPAFAGKDTIAVKGVPHPLFGSGGIGFLWSPAATLDNASSQFPRATLTQDTYFTLEVTDPQGCKGYDDVFIKVYKGTAYYIPNAFTPNGDGLNDVFRPTPVGIESTEFFRIWNRLGEIVYSTRKINEGWNGIYKASRQPAGTYVWQIKGRDMNGNPVEMKGMVNLIR